MSTSLNNMRITWLAVIVVSNRRHVCCGSRDVDSRASVCASLITVVKQSNIFLYAYMDIKYTKIHLLLCYDI